MLVLERSNKPGKKILMSGGGRCNFTNMYAEPENYHSQQPNPQFCKSAFARYTQWDFIAMVAAHGIPYHENGFGTTAGRWGMTPGPYLFIPFIGPTDFRDLLGQLGDIATDPLGWKPFENGQVIYARAIIDGLDQRAAADTQLQAIDDMSTDPYASLRSLYEQNRAGQIQEAITGMPGTAAPPLDELEDPGATQTPPPAGPNAPANGPASTLQPSAAIDRAMGDLLNRPLRLVSGSTLEPVRAG